MGYKLLIVSGDTAYKNTTKERKKIMDFLKAILGEEKFAEFKQAVDAYNGNEANKDKQIKLANLTEGGYVSKDKYTSLETDLSGKSSELAKANELIAELKKSTGKDAELQQKITTYESTIATLQAENEQLKTENALKFALVEAGAVDVDYLVFKAKEKGEIKLDESGKIKGVDDLITGLKTQIPSMFKGADGGSGGNGGRKVFENNLPGSDGNKTVTKEQFAAMGYADRLALKKSNPEQYKQLTE